MKSFLQYINEGMITEGALNLIKNGPVGIDDLSNSAIVDGGWYYPSLSYYNKRANRCYNFGITALGSVEMYCNSVSSKPVTIKFSDDDEWTFNRNFDQIGDGSVTKKKISNFNDIQPLPRDRSQGRFLKRFIWCLKDDNITVNDINEILGLLWGIRKDGVECKVARKAKDIEKLKQLKTKLMNDYPDWIFRREFSAFFFGIR